MSQKLLKALKLPPTVHVDEFIVRVAEPVELRRFTTSAISIERISYAVPESRPLSKTTLEIESGFSRTALWVAAEPIVVTIPSPTLART